jgi:hypothetical protein
VNGNLKELDRFILIAGGGEVKEIARERALSRNNPIEMHDTLECMVSRFYFSGLPDNPRQCEVADGVAFARFTQADGSVRHVMIYFEKDGTAAVAWDEVTQPGEPVWECNLGINWEAERRPINCFWIGAGRVVDGKVERKIFYKGSPVWTGTFDPANYNPLDWQQTLPRLITGRIGDCAAAYLCPKSAPTDPQTYNVWDESGANIVACAPAFLWCLPNGVPWAISEIEPPSVPTGIIRPKIEFLLLHDDEQGYLVVCR